MNQYEEKARELINKMYQVDDITGNYPMCLETAKECALIAVDEILNCNPHTNPFNTDVYSTYDYWFQVKLEIEKL